MMHVMEMFGGMFILRRITTAHMPADHAQPQMNPGIAKFDAFFANVSLRGRNLDLIEMFAIN